MDRIVEAYTFKFGKDQILINSYSFPSFIGQECTLPDGETVWVQVLNTLQLGAAEEAASLRAAMEMAGLTPLMGGVRLQFEQGGETAQCEWLAENAAAIARSHAEDAIHVPAAPIRRPDENETSWTERVQEWQQNMDGMEERRTEYIARERSAAFDHALFMQPDERLERCISEWREARHRRAYALAMVMETLARAVRLVSNRQQCRWPSAAAIADLPDAYRETLAAVYAGLDTVNPAQIPTSPPDCCL